MSEQHVVCNGAICQCKFGTTPDKIKVKQKDYYINDVDGTQKSIANTKDIGQPFEANTFGSCKKMNNNPCKPSITEWKAFYDKVTLQNGGKVLLEKSKGTCAVGAPSCIDITFHGQTASPNEQHAAKANEKKLAVLNPIVNVKESEANTKIPLPLS